MKIDRVILASDFNPTYYGFWNRLSEVYVEKFDITPTLLFFGTPHQCFYEAGLNENYGNIVGVTPNPAYHLPWQTTWGLFWATQMFPNDVCLIIGIDQVPLSGMFIKHMIKDFNDDAYVMLIADAYNTRWNLPGGASPSSYHIAKGSTFNRVYSFDQHFWRETEKVYNSGVEALWESTEGKWGIDESYSSHKLRQYDGEIVSLDNFRLLEQNRIECFRDRETPYDMNRLRAGGYSEAHLCRPYENHKEYIKTIYENIPRS